LNLRSGQSHGGQTAEDVGAIQVEAHQTLASLASVACLEAPTCPSTQFFVVNK